MGGRWRFAAGAVGIAALVAAAPATARPAVAFQVDVAHDGHQTARTPRPPLHRVWTRHLGTGEHRSVSYPLIVGRRVYVTVAAGADYSGTDLLALDARTGRTLWSHHLPDDYNWSAAAYDRGRVFAVNSGQHVYAFRARTGTPLWDRSYGGLGGPAPPVAWHGLLHVSSATEFSDPQRTRPWSGGLAALRESDGRLMWHRKVSEYAGWSAVAIGGGDVFADYGACPEAFAFRAQSGAARWRLYGDCYANRGVTPILHGGRLYVGDDSTCRCDRILSARSGRVIGRYDQDFMRPAFRGHVGYFAHGFGLDARDLRSGHRIWRFRHRPQAAPLVVGRTVYVPGASGRLWALDARSGKRRWSGRVRGAVTYEDSYELGYPTGGMGAASGMLVVPTEDGYLVAFRGHRR